MAIKPATFKQDIKVYALTAPTILSIAGKILAGSLDVTGREVVTLAASVLGQAQIPKSAPKKIALNKK